MVDFSDEKFLLDEIRKGNNQAFEYLFKAYYPRLRGYAIRFVEDEETARDIIQECFLRFWEAGVVVGCIGHLLTFCNGTQWMPELFEASFHCRETSDRISCIH